MIFVSETNVISKNNFGPKTFLVQTVFFCPQKIVGQKKIVEDKPDRSTGNNTSSAQVCWSWGWG